MKKQVYPEIGVGALISNKQGKILLVKSPKWFDKYTIPGGHVELGENLEVALIRDKRRSRIRYPSNKIIELAGGNSFRGVL